MKSINPNLYTTTQLKDVSIDGARHTFAFYKRLISRYNIQPKGKSERGSPTYDLAEITETMKKNAIDVIDQRVANNLPGVKRNGGEMGELFKEKIQEEINKLRKDNEKKDIQIDVLKKSLVEQQEVVDYLTIRYAVEGAILRQVLFTQVPLEVTGLTMAKAREKCVEYYNKVMGCMEESILLFEKKFDASRSEEIEKAIGEVFGDDWIESHRGGKTSDE